MVGSPGSAGGHPARWLRVNGERVSGQDQTAARTVGRPVGGARLPSRRPRGVIPQLRRVGRKVRRELTRLAGLSFQQLPPREAVRMAYNVLLRREPDEPAWTEQPGRWRRGR